MRCFYLKLHLFIFLYYLNPLQTNPIIVFIPTSNPILINDQNTNNIFNVYDLTLDRRYMPETPARPKETPKPAVEKSSGSTYGNQKVLN